jgi:hypothetical protein
VSPREGDRTSQQQQQQQQQQVAATPRSVFTFATAELSDEDEGGDDDDEGQSGKCLCFGEAPPSAWKQIKTGFGRRTSFYCSGS